MQVRRSASLRTTRPSRAGALHRLGRQGEPVHLAATHTASCSICRRPRLHDRLRGRARRHHPARREDGLGRLLRHSPADLSSSAGLRRRSVCDGRADWSRRDDRPADGPDRGHGPGGGGQRRLCEQDRRAESEESAPPMSPSGAASTRGRRPRAARRRPRPDQVVDAADLRGSCSSGSATRAPATGTSRPSVGTSPV